MIQPGVLDLVSRRNVPFAYTIDLVGVDLLGAALVTQVRLYPGAPGSPITDFASSIVVNSEAGLKVSTIALSLPQAAMDGMPSAGEAGTPMKLAWDLIIKPASGIPYVLVGGAFIVNPGVSRG